MTNTKFNPLPGKLMLVIDELYTNEVVHLWNNLCIAQNRTEDIIYPFVGVIVDNALKNWSPSAIAFSLQRSDERDEWFQVNESSSEIVCFPEWEVNEHIDIDELIAWLVKNDKWQEYDELASVATIEL